MHTRVKLLEGMQTILKLLGGYSQIIGGIYPPVPPGFDTPTSKTQKDHHSNRYFLAIFQQRQYVF